MFLRQSSYVKRKKISKKSHWWLFLYQIFFHVSTFPCNLTNQSRRCYHLNSVSSGFLTIKKWISQSEKKIAKTICTTLNKKYLFFVIKTCCSTNNKSANIICLFLTLIFSQPDYALFYTFSMCPNQHLDALVRGLLLHNLKTGDVQG